MSLAKNKSIVVVGGGMAGHAAALTLGKAGYRGRVILLSDEPHPPYERPVLSKTLLRRSDAEQVEVPYLGGNISYCEAGVELFNKSEVIGLDTTKNVAIMKNGKDVPYDKCVLATGGLARTLDNVKQSCKHVYSLRTLDDLIAIRGAVSNSRRALIVGAGILGMEAAWSLRQRGLDVTVMDYESRPMARVLPSEIASILEKRHKSYGIEIITNVRVENIREIKNGGVCVELSNGLRKEGDLCLIAVGQKPNVRVAEQSGLKCQDGIIVDLLGRTSNPNVFAAGDCARIARPDGGSTRLESWQHAEKHGVTVAKNALGLGDPYAALPWLWTDQVGWNIQILGELSDQAITLAGDYGRPERAFMAGIRSGRLVYAIGINRGGDIAAARRLMYRGSELMPKQLEAANFNLRKIARDVARR